MSQAEWLAARKDLLAKEKEFTRQRDALSAAAPQTALGQGGEAVRLRYASAARRRWPISSTASQLIVYHFMLGPGWEEGCPSCSFLADHFDGAAIAPRAPRCELAGGLARALARDRSVPEAHGLAFQVGIVDSERLQLRLSRVVHEGRNGRRQGVLQLRAEWSFRARKLPAPACSTRTSPAKSSIHTPPTRAVSIFWSAPTTISTSCRRAATKKVCRIRMAWVRHHDRYDTP